jgi:broad specificity phosphatase PhoE
MGMLYLVRHGRPLIDRTRPAHEWPLDPAYADDVRAARPLLPPHAAWFSSPEPKALATAHLLTDGPVEVVADLREHERHSTDWVDDFESVVRRAFDHPELPAYAGWEPLARTRTRVATAVAGILDRHPVHNVVLVGHGTAWTLLRAVVTGAPPDLEWWRRLSMPDVQSLGDVGPDDMLTP